ncbi:MAG: hypothetical protein AAF985_21000 [Bacteroidota bacterium]
MHAPLEKKEHTADQRKETPMVKASGGFSSLDQSSPISTLRNTPIQRKTEIIHKTADFTYNNDDGNVTEQVGAKMEAYLDPTDPVVGSGTDTSTGGPQLDLLHSINAINMVRGHLLNHDLGGFGVSENLYPINKGANSKHKGYAENPVGKELDNVLKGHVADPEYTGIYYKVEVDPLRTNSADLANNPSTFKCTADFLTGVTSSSRGVKANDPFLNVNITSNPSNNTSTAIDPATGLPATDFMRYKTVADGWDHGSRSGTVEGADDDWASHTAPGGRIQFSQLGPELADAGIPEETVYDKIIPWIKDHPKTTLLGTMALFLLVRYLYNLWNSDFEFEPETDLPELPSHSGL